MREYKLNKILLTEILEEEKHTPMSHLGSYNLKTLKILKEVSAKLGFRQMMGKNLNFKKFKINQNNF